MYKKTITAMLRAISGILKNMCILGIGIPYTYKH